MTALKIILIYVYDCEKRNPTQILKDMRVIRSEKSNFVILDRYNLCRASVELQHETSIERILSSYLSRFNVEVNKSSTEVIFIENYEIKFFRSNYMHILEYLCRVFFFSQP